MKLLLLVLIGISSFIRPSFAEDSDVTSVAVVRMQYAVANVSDGKKGQKQLKLDWEKKQKDLAKQKKDADTAFAEYNKTAGSLNPAERKDKEAKMGQMMQELQRHQQEAQQEFQKRDQEVSGPIIDKLRRIVGEVVHERGYTMALNEGEDVFYFQEKDDITKEVMKRYEKQK